ncbi:hypothetical protein KC354_g161 [Hortaea werneckii]|nr:hypothetical protein KC354_g161 [Hortaea werneckii]
MALLAFSARVASTRPSALFSSDMINALMRCSIASHVLASPSSLLSLHKLKVLVRSSGLQKGKSGWSQNSSPDHGVFLVDLRSFSGLIKRVERDSRFFQRSFSLVARSFRSFTGCLNLSKCLSLRQRFQPVA